MMHNDIVMLGLNQTTAQIQVQINTLIRAQMTQKAMKSKLILYSPFLIDGKKIALPWSQIKQQSKWQKIIKEHNKHPPANWLLGKAKQIFKK